MADSNLKVYKPDARFWHASQCVGDRIYVWGGRTRSYCQEKLTYFEEFDSNKRSWRTLKDIEGISHPGVSQVACASFGDFLYFYGGNDGQDFNNILSQLDLKEKTWIQLSRENASLSPMKKDSCGMAHFTTQSGERKLIVMCGYGKINGGSTDAASSFSEDKNSKKGGTGWTNEIHMFDITKDAWSVPEITGNRPEPCADVTFTSINKQRGILYGGRKRSCLSLFDIDSMSIIEISESKLKSPPNRLGHHAVSCFGFDTKRPQLLLSGGRRNNDITELPLSDVWMLDIKSGTWMEQKVPDHAKIARWGHTIATIIHTDCLVEVLMFGGSSSPFNANDIDSTPKLAHPVSFIYGFHSNEWVLLGVVDKSESWQFGDRVRELAQTKSCMRGVEVCGETRVVITNSAQSLEWEGYGLKLHIQEDSLPKDVKQIGINIKASIAGCYELPENSNLVSAIYWFDCKPKCTLKKQALLELRHCAKPENASKLSFVGAKSSTQDQLPYQFSQLKGGQFNSQNSYQYGVLELHNFCGKAVIQEGSEEKYYRASVFYLRQNETQNREIYFVMTLDTPPHLRAIEMEYKMKPDIGLVVEFTTDRISLDIPIEGTGVLSGWKIIPLVRPVVMKEEVDKFKLERGIPTIPHCKLLARLEDPSKREPLLHTVNLQGAKYPRNVFKIHIEAVTQSPAPCTLQMSDLMKELYGTISDKWEEFGLTLNIGVDKVNQIKTDNHNNCRSCMRELLKVYVKRIDPAPSWEAVVEAIEALRLDELVTIATHLRSKYLQRNTS